MPQSLRSLFPRASFVGCADVLATDATADSRKCTPGATFAAVRGTRLDGTQFVPQAVANGAESILTEMPLPEATVPQCVVPDVRSAYGRLCAALSGLPASKLKTVGVTGTNGKTTVTWLVRSILRAAHRRCGLLGTVEYHDGVDGGSSTLTTPDSKTLHGWLGRMVERDAEFAALEISSHALDQDRVAGVDLSVAVVTNITQDHFDYHGDVEHYRQSKARVFTHCKRDARIVLNTDDERVRSLIGAAGEQAEVVTFGFGDDADVSAEILNETLAGTRFLLRRGNERIEVRTSLIGRYNVSNCLAAVAAVSQFGLSLDEIAVGVASLETVPGRLERIDAGQPFAAFVDYAHTEDALRRCTEALSRLTHGRVICVFGAGGDRDRTKRPLLGRAAANADVVVVTSDNPRSENPHAIIADILAGIPAPCETHVEADRAAAIAWAVEHARPGDCVLVAGKGHETEQILGTARVPC
ncbi:MAG: UDP-N-acetylmuramoyl-L-alanyl-D-glutamate--2,6-diaminopimelate ligase, partial [Planctomycetaceae bacterium]